jgi:hypothetical protein
MATTVTKVVDPDLGSGYDYDSLFDWEAAQQGDLTGARNEIAVATCRCTGGTADTTILVIAGWTTSATQYWKIWTDPAESYRHNGTYQTGNKYRHVSTTVDNINLWVDCSYGEIHGLQFSIENTGVAVHQGCIGLGDATAGTLNLLLKDCILRDTATGLNAGIYRFGIALQSSTPTITAKIVNCIFYGFKGGGDHHSSALMMSYAGGTYYIYNSTVYDCYCGLSLIVASTANLKNCLFASNTICIENSTGTITVNYCASSDGTADDFGGSGNRVDQTFTFVGAADFHLASNDAGALGYGLNLYNDANYPFQTDIDGQDRGGAAASWDIGADQWIPTDSCAWGHDTGVTQDSIRNFSGKWYGTGEVISTGDGERIELAVGEYLISEPIIVAADSIVTLRKNSYFARS